MPDLHNAGPSQPEQGATLRATFRERRLAIGTMDRPLRLATGAALGCTIGAAVFVALRDVGHQVVTLGVTDGVRTTLATGLFAATLVFLAVGLAYLFAGAVFAHRSIAVVAVVVVVFLIGYETGILGLGSVQAVLPGWARWSTRGLLLALLVVAGVVLALRRGRHGDDARDRRLRAVTLCVYVAIFAGYLLVLGLASPTVAGLSNFPGTVDLLMVDMALLATPFLQIAAIDFGEWGAITGHRLSAASRGRLPHWLVPGALCLTLLVIGEVRADGSVAHRAEIALAGTLLLGAAVAVLLLAGRALRLGSLFWPEGTGFAAVFVVTALSLWVIVPVAARASGALTVTATPAVSDSGSYTAAANVRTVHLAKRFTALVPAGWQVAAAGAGTAVRAVDPQFGPMVVAVQPLPGVMRVGDLAARLHLRPVGAPLVHGGIQRLRVDAGPKLAESLWVVSVPHERAPLLLVDKLTRRDPDRGTLALGALVGTVRSVSQPPATIPATAAVETPAAARQATTDRLRTLGLVLELLVGAAALIAVATVGRRWPGRVRVIAPLLAGVSLFSVLFLLDAPARVLWGTGSRWPTLTENGTWTGLGVLGLLALAAARGRSSGWARRMPSALVALAGGAAALFVMNVLYGHAMSLSRVALWAPIILLLAVAWDVTMSGESMTNHGTRLWPRSSRVLLFLGYVVLVGATVVYYSGQRAAGSGRIISESFFEPESVTQAALLRVALPVMITLFLLRVFGTDEPAEPTPEPPAAAPTLALEPGAADAEPELRPSIR